MRSRALMVFVAAAGVIAGCGGNGTDKPAPSGSKAAPAKSQSAKQSQPASDLAAFTVRTELKGFSPVKGSSGGATDPAEWLDLAQDTTLTPERLQALGFVAGYKRDLREKGSATTFGRTQVEEFKTPEQAKAEVKRNLAPTPTIKITPYAVAGLAGAQGATAKGSTIGDSVMFTRGRYFLQVARMRASDSAGKSRASVVAAAKKLDAKLP